MASSADDDRAPAHLWLEVIGGALLLVGLGLQYLGEEGRFLDTLTKEQRQVKLVRPGMLEIVQKTWSPAKQAGIAVFGVAAVIGSIGIVLRLGRKEATMNTSNDSDGTLDSSGT